VKTTVDQELWDALASEATGGGAGGEMSREELAEMLLNALMSMDRDELRRLAAMAVTAFAGMEPGRPVGGTYYLYRTLRQLDLDDLGARLMARAARKVRYPPTSSRASQARGVRERLRTLRQLVEAEIRRRLSPNRGVEAMRAHCASPPRGVDFMHASREEMLALQRAIYPLTRSLRSRGSRSGVAAVIRGHLDFRRTVRASLSYGGVPAEPKFRNPHPSKPEIMVVADISGSVASFARFTLQFVYAMASQFSKVARGCSSTASTKSRASSRNPTT